MTALKKELEKKCKKETNNRAGALCAMKKMMEKAPAVAEPFLVADLALLLEAAADKMKPVSVEADGAAKALANGCSCEAVRAMMPALLAEGDGKTQTNVLRLEILSLLAKKAPKQMGRCLADVVPVVSALMWDVKAQVKEAATTATNDGAPRQPNHSLTALPIRRALSSHPPFPPTPCPAQSLRATPTPT